MEKAIALNPKAKEYKRDAYNEAFLEETLSF